MFSFDKPSEFACDFYGTEWSLSNCTNDKAYNFIIRKSDQANVISDVALYDSKNKIFGFAGFKPDGTVGTIFVELPHKIDHSRGIIRIG